MRRTLLACLAFCLVAQIAAHGTSADASRPKVAIPQDIQKIPDGYFDPSPQPGTLQELTYQTYFIFVITGTSDFAYTFDQSRTQRMGASRFFVDADRSTNGNFAYRVKQGYSHNGTAAMEYTYNGLKAFWGGKDQPERRGLHAL